MLISIHLLYVNKTNHKNYDYKYTIFKYIQSTFIVYVWRYVGKQTTIFIFKFLLPSSKYIFKKLF